MSLVYGVDCENSRRCCFVFVVFLKSIYVYKSEIFCNVSVVYSFVGWRDGFEDPGYACPLFLACFLLMGMKS